MNSLNIFNSKITTGGLTVVIGILQIILEQFIKNEVFRCPCDYPPYKKILYFILLIVVPFSLFLFIGFSINPNFWKFIVGCKPSKCCKSSKCCHKIECCGYSWKHCCKVFWSACILPIFWVILIFIDGHYLACTVAEKPGDSSKKQTCSLVSLLNFLKNLLNYFKSVCFKKNLDNK